MTDESRKTPPAARRRSTATPPAEPAPTPTGRTRRRSAPKEPPTRTPAPNSRPVVVDPDALPGEETPGEPPLKLTVNLPESLYHRAAGVVAHADFTGEPPEVESMTALVRLALVEKVAEYEKKYNVGMAFPAPARLRRGRTPKR